MAYRNPYSYENLYDPGGAASGGRGIYDGGPGLQDPTPGVTYHPGLQPPAAPGATPAPYWQNPYAANPRDPWSQWRQPTDRTVAGYYTQHPQEAWQQYTNAFGSPDGNLQKFMQSQFGQTWADYIRQSENAGNGQASDFQFTDTLDGGLAARLQNQWANQTPYQRGENYGTLSAGRRV